MNKSIRKVKLISRNIFSSCNILFQFQSTILTKRESPPTSIVLMMHGLLERRKSMKILSDGVLSGLQLFQEKQRESLQLLFIKWFKMQLLPALKRLHITTPNQKRLIISLNLSSEMPLDFGTLKTSKKDFQRSEYQKRKDKMCPFSSLAFRFSSTHYS